MATLLHIGDNYLLICHAPLNVRQFIFGDHFLNYYGLYVLQCTDIIRRIFMLMTITQPLFVISLLVEMYFFLVARSCHYHNSLDENMNIVLRDQSGIIKTPLYQYGDHGQSSYSDQRYKRHSLEDHQCHWKIIAPKGKVLRVEFSSFRLYQNYRYVEIADRINGMKRRIIKRTGILTSFTFYSWGNELSIYINDYEYFYTGFSANYTTVPAGENKWYPI